MGPFFSLLVLGCLASGGVPQEGPGIPRPTPPTGTTGAAKTPAIPGSREVVLVADAVKVLKEDSLPPDNLANADPSTRGSAVANEGQAQDRFELDSRGLRLYAFTLQPRESIAFRLKGVPPERILLSGSLPQKTSDMTLRIRNANKLPEAVRGSRYEVANCLPEPFTLVLRLQGFVKYPYTLEVERK